MPKPTKAQHKINQLRSRALAGKPKHKRVPAVPTITVAEHDRLMLAAMTTVSRYALPEPADERPAMTIRQATPAPRERPPSLASVSEQLDNILGTTITLSMRLGTIRDRLAGPRPENKDEDIGPVPSGHIPQMMLLLERIRNALDLGHVHATDIECYQG